MNSYGRKINKIIHYCWFGKNEKSGLINKCIESWKKFCPDYEIIEWNEDNYNINACSYIKEAYDNKKWAFVTDYVRLDVIYNYGGIYLDTDVELTKNIDFLLEKECFFCFEKGDKVATGLGFGANKKHPLVKKLLDDYNDIHFINNGKFDLTPCTIRNQIVLKEYLDKIENYNVINQVENITFYPSEYFCPLNFENGKLDITENTVAIHWYGASWMTNKNKFERKLKYFFKKIIGEKIYESLKKVKNGK